MRLQKRLLQREAGTVQRKLCKLSIYQTHHLTVNPGIRLAYTDEGSGPVTILLIHGLGTSRLSMDKLVGELSGQMRVIAPDLPGYGESSVGDYPFGMVFFADILNEFIALLGLGQVVLAGHSMGGQIAIVQSLKHPGPIRQLILLAPAGFETFTREEGIWISQVYKPEILESVPFDKVEKNVHLNFFHFPPDASPIVEQRRALHHQPELHGAYCRMLSSCVSSMLSTPVFDRLHHLDMPVLTIFGLEDALIPNAVLHPGLSVRGIALNGHNQLRHGQLSLIPECGHMLQWECSDVVANEIKRFLND